MYLCTVDEQTLIAVLLMSSVLEDSWSRNTVERANPLSGGQVQGISNAIQTP